MSNEHKIFKHSFKCSHTYSSPSCLLYKDFKIIKRSYFAINGIMRMSFCSNTVHREALYCMSKSKKSFPIIIIINPVLIRFYPRKRGWPDLPYSASNLSHSYSPSCVILCILLLQTNTLTLLLHL